jgi:S1-C subfamily serine protease
VLHRSVTLALVIAMSLSLIAACGSRRAGDDSTATEVAATAIAAHTATEEASAAATAAVEDGSFASVPDLVEAVQPAVVTVVSLHIFRRFPGDSGADPEVAGSGTGVVISADGHIVTNAHVVESADLLRILFSDGSEIGAEMIGVDVRHEIAVLKVEASSVIATVALANSDTLRVGEAVVAIGNVLGQYSNTVTEGIVSGLGRTLETRGGAQLGNLIQHDAAINPGNSGGPLFRMTGEVIGINTAVVRYTEAGEPTEGLGFAIPSNTVASIVDQLISANQSE